MNKVHIINGFFTDFTTATYFLDVIKRDGYEAICILTTSQDAIASDTNFALYIDDGTHYVIKPRKDIKKILYIIDTHMGFDWDEYLIKYADFVFCAQYNAVEKIQKINPCVAWLPLACDPTVHCASNVQTQYDISFIGAINDPKRKKYLEKLQERYGKTSYLGRAKKDDIGKIYSSSKIVVNMAINNDINMRFFEALCSGALLITEHVQDNGEEYLLASEEKPMCVFYNTYDEMVEKIDYYLEHEDERQEIAQRGRAFALKNTYESRWKTILQQVESVQPRNVLFVHYIATELCFFMKRALNYLLKRLP